MHVPGFPAFLKLGKKVKQLTQAGGLELAKGSLNPMGARDPTCHPVFSLISPAQGGPLPPSRADSLAIPTSTDRPGNETPRATQGRSLFAGAV